MTELEESRKIVAEFLVRKQQKAFEFAQKLAREGDQTQCGDLARCFMELLQKTDGLETERQEVLVELSKYDAKHGTAFGNDHIRLPGAVVSIIELEASTAKADQIVQWMENGCPVFLTEDDDIARPLGDCRLAATSLKKGLAAIGNAKKEGSIWRRIE